MDCCRSGYQRLARYFLFDSEYFCHCDHLFSFRISYAVIVERQKRLVVSEVQIQTIDDSLDYRCIDNDPGLQSNFSILPEFAPGKLDHLLSLERNLEPELAVVFACSFYFRRAVLVPHQGANQLAPNHPEESDLGGPVSKLIV